MKRSSFFICIALGALTLGCLFGCTPAQYSLTITANGGGATDPAPGTYTHDKGTSVSVTAIATAGFTFGRWEGNASGSGNSVTVIMDADKSVAAVFMAQSEGEGETVEGEVVEGEVTAEGEGEGEVTAEGEGESAEGEVVAEGEGEATEGETQAVPNSAIIIDSFLGSSYSCSSAPLPLAGRLLVPDASAMPATLNWQVSNPGGQQNGQAPVAPEGTWAASLPLSAGDNAVTLTVTDPPGKVEVNVTYTPNYQFGGPLSVSPDVVYLNEARELTALLALTDAKTAPANTQLIRIDGGVETELGTFADDGSAEHGDETADDGIYACKFTLTEAAGGNVELRARTGIAGGGTATSEAFNILVTGHFSQERITELNATLSDHGSRMEQAYASGIPALAAEAKKIAAELKARPDVEYCALTSDGLGVRTGYKDGIITNAYLDPVSVFGVPEAKAAQAPAAAAAAPVPAPADSRPVSTPYQLYESRTGAKINKTQLPQVNIGNAKALAFCPHTDQFGEDKGGLFIYPKDAGLEITLERDYPPATHALPYPSVERLKGLEKYGFIMIDTHGSGGHSDYPKPGGRDFFSFDSGDPAWVVEKGKAVMSKPQYEDDINRGRLSMVLQGRKNMHTLGVEPAFFEHYSGKFPKSLVLMGACFSARNKALASVFLRQGAGAYLGYSEAVTNNFVCDSASELLQRFAFGDRLLSNSYNAMRVRTDPYVSQIPNYTDPPAYFTLWESMLLLFPETWILPGDVQLVMMWVPGGKFMMGRYLGEQDSSPQEDPQHEVTVGGYWMAKYELTKRQWAAVMGTTPWTRYNVLGDLDSPAVYVSWDDAQAFLTALNTYTKQTTFRLPSEAQWEYACRGGDHVPPTRFYWGDDPGYMDIGLHAWWSGNCESEPYAHVVGQKSPNVRGLNVFGLYDMSGNVWEWCEDDWHYSYTGAPTGGQAWVDSPRGSYRVLRGGCWHFSEFFCRSAMRHGGAQDSMDDGIGFRLVRSGP